jgi:hypothetical protein
MLYAEDEFPAWVIALAGHAASNAREAGTYWTSKAGMIPLHATTIHRALGLQSEGDDGPDAFKNKKQIKCGVLGIEEISMISSPLLAAVVKSANARHFVLVGDVDQLPPIGPGKPFRDVLTAGKIPTTHLTKNWRTDCQGIRDLCADMLAFDNTEFVSRFPDYVKAGGVEFVPCNWNERASTAAMIVARLVDEKIDLEQIAILSPHKTVMRVAKPQIWPSVMSLVSILAKSKRMICLSSARTTITRRHLAIPNRKRRFTTVNGVALSNAVRIILI